MAAACTRCSFGSNLRRPKSGEFVVALDRDGNDRCTPQWIPRSESLTWFQGIRSSSEAWNLRSSPWKFTARCRWRDR